MSSCFLTFCFIFLPLSSSSFLSCFLPSILPVNILEIGGVLGVVVFDLFDDVLISFSLAEVDDPVLDGVKLDHGCPDQKSLAAESS